MKIEDYSRRDLRNLVRKQKELSGIAKNYVPEKMQVEIPSTRYADFGLFPNGPENVNSKSMLTIIQKASQEEMRKKIIPFFEKVAEDYGGEETTGLYAAYSLLRDMQTTNFNDRSKISKIFKHIENKYHHNELRLQGMKMIAGKKEGYDLSGITAVDGKFFGVNDKGTFDQIASIKKTTSQAQALFSADKGKMAGDFEGITYDDYTKKFFIADEKGGNKVYTFDAETKKMDLFLDLNTLKSSFPELLKNLGTGGGNAQIEGIALTRNSKGLLTLFLAKERNPLELYVINFDEGDKNPKVQNKIIPIHKNGRPVRDIGDICYFNNRMFLLARSSRKVIEIDLATGQEKNSWSFARTESEHVHNCCNDSWLYGTAEGLVLEKNTQGQLVFHIAYDNNGKGTTADGQDNRARILTFIGNDR